MLVPPVAVTLPWPLTARRMPPDEVNRPVTVRSLLVITVPGNIGTPDRPSGASVRAVQAAPAPTKVACVRFRVPRTITAPKPETSPDSVTVASLLTNSVASALNEPVTVALGPWRRTRSASMEPELTKLPESCKAVFGWPAGRGRRCCRDSRTQGRLHRGLGCRPQRGSCQY